MWVIVVILSVLLGVCFYVYKSRRSNLRRIHGEGQGIFITGCDTGFGYDLAKRLDGLGFRVFAGCLNSNGKEAGELARSCSKLLSVVQLDVTKEDQITSAKAYVETVHRNTGCGLWALVNNAGIDCYGDIEFSPTEFYRRVADVNLFGMVHVTKTFLPMIRKSKGRVINNTSVKGRLSLPRISVYGITKYGGENFSDCLRLEMRKFGVKVVIVEPGNFGGVTGILSGSNLNRLKDDKETMWNRADPEVKQVYGRKYLESQFSELERAADTSCRTTTPVIDAFEDAVTLENPRTRYLVHGGRGLFDKCCVYATLNSYLPTAWMDFLVDRWFNSSGVAEIGI